VSGPRSQGTQPLRRTNATLPFWLGRLLGNNVAERRSRIGIVEHEEPAFWKLAHTDRKSPGGRVARRRTPTARRTQYPRRRWRWTSPIPSADPAENDRSRVDHDVVPILVNELLEEERERNQRGVHSGGAAASWIFSHHRVRKRLALEYERPLDVWHRPHSLLLRRSVAVGRHLVGAREVHSRSGHEIVADYPWPSLPLTRLCSHFTVAYCRPRPASGITITTRWTTCGLRLCAV
jgi:hypothetical protein